MATGGGKGWKQQDGGGSGSWLIAGLKIGAALGAAALGAYAAVKVAQQEEKESPMRSRCGSDSSEDEEGGDSPSSFSRGSTSRDVLGRSAKPKRKPLGSLVEELNEYYDSQISAPSTKRMAILDLVEKTRQRLSGYMIKNHRRLVKGELTPAALERVASGQQAQFKLMLPLAFNPQMWEFIDAADTVLDMPGFFCVRRVNLDFFRIGQSPWDRFLVGSYLCPELLMEYWKKIIVQMLREEMVVDFYCSVKLNAGGIEMNIENPVGGYADMLCIKIIPYMKINKGSEVITIVAQSVSPSQNPAGLLDSGMSGNPHENLWLRSLEEEAMRKMDALDADGGCRRKCLQILDGVQCSRPPLKMLTRYHLVTILLNACEEETEWDEEMLAERFLDLLKALEGYLRTGGLRDHFNKEVDILVQCCSPGRLSESQKWLAHMLESKDRISDLLYD